jgi:hypothetical protein
MSVSKDIQGLVAGGMSLADAQNQVAQNMTVAAPAATALAGDTGFNDYAGGFTDASGEKMSDVAAQQMVDQMQDAIAAAQGGGSGGGSYGGWNSTTGGEMSGTPSSTAGDSPGSMTAADGGPVTGKGDGSGIDDKVHAKLSPGEFVISKDVVDAMGVDFFDKLQSILHTPASVQAAQNQRKG